MSFEDKFHWLLASYIASPQWLKSTLGHAYSAIPLTLRIGASYKQWLAIAQEQDPGQIAHLVDAKLWQTLRCALMHVPAYREYQGLLQTENQALSLLRKLPLSSKESIKQNLARYLADNKSERQRMSMFTGGSTATPMQFYIERGVTRVKEYAFIERFHAEVGLTSKDVILALRGRSVPGAKDGSRFWMYEPIKKHLILSSDHLLPANMPDYIKAIHQWQPRFIQAFPSALYPLAKWLDQHPEPALTAKFKGVLLFSENVYEHQYDLFRKVFDCPVLKHYGHSERAVMAASRPNDGRYLVYPQYGYVELIDFNGQPVTQAGGLGQIVTTSFDNLVMPFVRYQTGDLAILGETIDPSQAHHLIFERIEGRLQEFVLTHDLRLISIATLGAAHFNELAHVGAIQYEQFEPGKVILHVEVQGNLALAMKQKISHAVFEKTQGGCVLQVVETGVIPRSVRGKHQMLLQHVDLSPYLPSQPSQPPEPDLQ